MWIQVIGGSSLGKDVFRWLYYSLAPGHYFLVISYLFIFYFAVATLMLFCSV